MAKKKLEHLEKCRKELLDKFNKIIRCLDGSPQWMDHLKRIHPNFKEDENTSDPSILDVFLQRNLEYAPDSQQKKEMDRYVMLMIERDLLAWLLTKAFRIS